MSFANLSPADRLKAGGMIGIIIVLLFFIVHTMLGAIRPNKQAAEAPLSPPAASMPPAPGGPPPPPPDEEKAVSGADFPTAKALSLSKNIKGDPKLDMDIHDPFVPIAKPNARPGAGPGGSAPNVAIKPLPDFGSLNPHRPVGHFGPSPFVNAGARAATGGLGSGLPGLTGSGASGAMPVQPLPQPEIRVIGVVFGESSVATVQVAGRTVNLRPGDVITSGYRLAEINREDVLIRHNGETHTVRIGDVLNPSKQ